MGSNKLRTNKLTKYKHIIQMRRQSTLTKSKKPYLYILFLDYDAPADIPFQDLADYSGVKIDVLKGMIRSAKHSFTISLALLDIGVDEGDIPVWFSRNPRLNVKTKRSRTVVVESKDVVVPRAYKQLEREVNNYLVAGKSLEAYPEAKKLDKFAYSLWPINMGSSTNLNKESLEMLKGLNNLIDENQGLQKKPKHRERTLKELFTVVNAYIEANKIQEDIDSQNKFNGALLMWYTFEQNRPSLSHEDVNDFIEGISEALAKACQLLPKPPVKKLEDLDFTPLLPSNNYQAIDKQIKELEKSQPQQRKEDMLSLAKIVKEERDRNKQIKYLRHGNLIKPQKIFWPPWYKPIDVRPR